MSKIMNDVRYFAVIELINATSAKPSEKLKIAKAMRGLAEMELEEVRQNLECSVISDLSDYFRANGLTLPKQSTEIVINPKLIAKIPFYTFVITWVITLAYLIKL